MVGRKARWIPLDIPQRRFIALSLLVLPGIAFLEGSGVGPHEAIVYAGSAAGVDLKVEQRLSKLWGIVFLSYSNIATPKSGYYVLL